MTRDEAITQLVAVRSKWKNNGSSLEFSKEEGKIFNHFRMTNTQEDFEKQWPEIRLEAFKRTEHI